MFCVKVLVGGRLITIKLSAIEVGSKLLKLKCSYITIYKFTPME